MLSAKIWELVNKYEDLGLYKMDELLYEVPEELWLDSNRCLDCDSSFGFWNRKRHCRSCGDAVCQKCSNNRIGKHKRRICDRCALMVQQKLQELEQANEPVMRQLPSNMRKGIVGMEKTISNSTLSPTSSQITGDHGDFVGRFVTSKNIKYRTLKRARTIVNRSKGSLKTIHCPQINKEVEIDNVELLSLKSEAAQLLYILNPQDPPESSTLSLEQFIEFICYIDGRVHTSKAEFLFNWTTESEEETLSSKAFQKFLDSEMGGWVKDLQKRLGQFLKSKIYDARSELSIPDIPRVGSRTPHLAPQITISPLVADIIQILNQDISPEEKQNLLEECLQRRELQEEESLNLILVRHSFNPDSGHFESETMVDFEALLEDLQQKHNTNRIVQRRQRGKSTKRSKRSLMKADPALEGGAIHTGVLWKKGQVNSRSWKKRTVELTTAHTLTYKSEKQNRILGNIDLKEIIQIRRINPETEEEYADLRLPEQAPFVFLLKTQNRDWIFASETIGDLLKWKNLLCKETDVENF